MSDRLYRSRTDRVIAGVAGGLADQLGLDPSLVRVVWVILAFVTGGLFALVYVVMMFVVPEEPPTDAAWNAWPADPPDADAASTERTRGGEASFAEATAPDGTGADATTPAFNGADRPTETIPDAAPRVSAPAGSAPQAGATGSPPHSAAWPPGPSDRWTERAARRQARTEARAARRASRHDSGGAVLFGLILVMIGGWLLAQRYLPAADFDRLWPIALVVVGLVLVVLSLRPGRDRP
ncbi:MAG TPA: PspC domain-containing protein [Candidatus Limnocylindrales bacterium]|nr:PspC domain-containing protein [Candidatus Limnocylindrales bacterium]